MAPYEEGGWGACTCSARASGLLKNSHAPTGQTGATTEPKLLRSHAYCAYLKSIGGAVPVGCRLHAPEAENFFDVGSSGESKL